MCETIEAKDSIKLHLAKTTKASLVQKHGQNVGLRDQGYPNFLTEKEYEIFVSFH